MICEVINGLKLHENSRALKIPLGIIPAGTGNGLAGSLHVEQVKDAIQAIIQGRTRPMDIMKVQLAKDPVPMFGFLRLVISKR